MLGLYIGTGFVLVAFLFSLLYIKVKLNLEFSISSGNTLLTVTVSSVFKQWQKRYSQDINAIPDYVAAAWKKHQEKKETPSESKKSKPASGAYYSLATFALKRMVVERLDWKSRVGTNDAMYTALSSGGLWTVKGILTGLLSSKTRLQDIDLQVEPDFDNAKLVSHLYCILKMRIVHIIFIAFYFLVLTVRGYINGYRAGKADPSHRRTYENSHAGH